MSYERQNTYCLTEKQLAFCEEYMKDFNGTQAAIRAGYSANTAGEIACENLKKPEVQAFMSDLINANETDIEAETREIMRNLKAIMRGEKVKTVYYTDKKGRHRARHEACNINERLKAIDMLMKHYGMYHDKPVENYSTPIFIDINGEESLTDDGTQFSGYYAEKH